MKTAVQIGAGNIGRGFMAEIFYDSGYQIVFIDINQKLIDAINQRGHYELRLVNNEETRIKEISGISAISALCVEEAADAIAKADVMAVSVGVHALSKLPPLLVKGFRRRWKTSNRRPLNILVCENLIGAPEYFRGLLQKHLTPEETVQMEKTVGLVETSIGRMVPDQTGTDPLSMVVEPYCKLPVDRDAFVGDIPDLKHLELFSPFIFHIQRKLFIHNFSHAALAYLGYLLDKPYIHDSVANDAIARITLFSMKKVAVSLAAEHGVPVESIIEHISELMYRYKNRVLRDSVERVGRDPRRKLGPDDRIIGPYRLARKHGQDVPAFPLIIAAALRFRPASDEIAQEIALLIEERGIAEVLKEICCLSSGEVESLLPNVETYYAQLGQNPENVIQKFAESV